MVFERKEPKVVLGKHAPCSCRQNCGILGGKRATAKLFCMGGHQLFEYSTKGTFSICTYCDNRKTMNTRSNYESLKVYQIKSNHVRENYAAASNGN